MGADSSKTTTGLWSAQGLQQNTPGHLLHFVCLGIFIGLLAGCVISFFRLIKGMAYNSLLVWMAPENRDFLSILIYAVFIVCAALIVCWLIKNPALRLGGEKWIVHSIQDGQPHAWSKILFPKFISILLVLACGISVGSEGPSIQMGAASALGLKRFSPFQFIERRFFILAGCAAGLAAAFSAPFAGICYVYEVMQQKMSKALFTFLLSAAFGVYIACYQIFQLNVLLPLPTFFMPELTEMWILLPLALAGGIIGICYSFLLLSAVKITQSQKKLPIHWLPLFAFGAAFLIVLFFPEISGEGLDIFTPIMENRTTVTFLLVLLGCKLLFTAFCYGTFIPAGEMVPLLCVGGITGAIYFDILQMAGLIDAGLRSSCIVMGMAAAFAAAEHAPVTAVVLVTEMSGAWGVAEGLLFTGAIGYFMARFLKIPRFLYFFREIFR